MPEICIGLRIEELSGESYKQSTIEIYCYKDVMCQNLVVSQNLLLLAVWKIGHRGTTKPRVHQWSILFTLRIVICSSRVFDFVILWVHFCTQDEFGVNYSGRVVIYELRLFKRLFLRQNESHYNSILVLMVNSLSCTTLGSYFTIVDGL